MTDTSSHLRKKALPYASKSEHATAKCVKELYYREIKRCPLTLELRKLSREGNKRVPQLCNTNGQQWFVCVSQVCNDDHNSFITGLYSITHTLKLAVQNTTAQKAVSAWKIK